MWSLTSWSSARAQRTERSWVAGETHRLRWIAMGELALFIATIGALLLVQWPGTPWQLRLPASLLVGCQVGRVGLLAVRRAGAYRSGWLDGRSAFVAAMGEAQRRGMAPGDWLAAELARDYAVLGVEAEVIQVFMDEPPD
jgi:hypothetical protein